MFCNWSVTSEEHQSVDAVYRRIPTEDNYNRYKVITVVSIALWSSVIRHHVIW